MSNAFFWIASSERYVLEAVQSVKSVRQHMPNVKTAILLTGFDYGAAHFDITHKLPPRQYELWYIDFVNYMNIALDILSNFDKLVYLDDDTYMCAPVPELFELLDQFQVASTHAPARTISPTFKRVPGCFAEFNTGVFAFRNNYVVKQLFVSWLETYKANPGLYGENDQAPLRECLYYWDGKQYVLPIEYNCRFGFGGQASGKVKILHGRSDNMPQLAININENEGIRGWRRGDFK